MNDTPREVAASVRERLLARTGAERVLMGSRMFDVARAMALASFPPGLSEIETKRLLCERLYGREVDAAAFVAHLKSRRAKDPQPPTSSPPRGVGREPRDDPPAPPTSRLDVGEP
jgi:hypothetical protein